MVPVPQSGTVILGSAENERNLSRAVGRQTLRRQLGGVIEPVGDILISAAAAGSLHAGRDLQSVGFVRRSFQHPAQAISDGQTRRHPPGILPVKLIVIDREAAIDRSPLSQRAAIAIEVIDAVALGENAQQDGSCAVIVRTEVAVHCGIRFVSGWIYVVGRIERAGGVGDTSRVEIHRVGLNVGERVLVAGVIVANQKYIGTELEGVILTGPVQTVAQLVGGHEENSGARKRNEVVQPVQQNRRILRDPCGLASLADVAPVKVVDQLGRDERTESDGDALAVVQYCRGGGLAGELLQSRFFEILRLTAQKQGLRAVGRDVVIEAGNVGVETGVGVRSEAIT